MSSIFEKLNIKDAREIVVLNAPSSFESELALLVGVKILRSLQRIKNLNFALAFVVTQADLDALSTALTTKAVADATLWFAYPKKSSKKYRCEFNRDSGWDVLRTAGYDSVRMVAIDADWSALRFRKLEFIKSLGRNLAPALAQAGRQGAGAK
ncbi:MAG: hypothetical protein JWR16_2001 [Nevskia sp.]|nr:hypothetical protein [Nevskia sp.]